MKNVTEFVEQIVKIDFLEQFNCYGHYPFQLIAERKDGKIDMCVLALGGDVAACYGQVGKYIKQDAKKIFLSLDFPSGGDMLKDFVAIFSIIDNKIDVFAIPYDIKDGKKHDVITESKHLENIVKEFKSVLKLN